ncbi:MAG: dynamin family protein [Acidobacteria bacterium]|nr:dynamin family protein [Acidobacteriota bacterium]
MNDNLEPLRVFKRRKELLLGCAEQIATVAAEMGDTEIKATTDDFVARFRHERFLVVAVGEFKWGKSTFVNALVRKDICPVDVVPKTARVMHVSAAKDGTEKVTVHFRGDRAPEVRALAPEDLDDLVGTGGRQLEQVDHIQVEISAADSLVTNDVVLVDTPGLKSLYREHDRITRDYLPRADAILFFFSVAQPFADSEREYLVSFRQFLDRTVFVVNQADQKNETQRAALKRFIVAQLQEHVVGGPADHLPVFMTSGQRALDAVKSADAEGMRESGLPDVESWLAKYLGNERGALVVFGVVQKLQDIRTGLERQLQIARTLLEQLTNDLKEGARRRSTFLRCVDDVRRDGPRVEHVVDLGCEQLHGQLASRVGSVAQRLSQRIRAWVPQCSSERQCRQALPSVLTRQLQDLVHELDEQQTLGLRNIAAAAAKEQHVLLARMDAAATEHLSVSVQQLVKGMGGGAEGAAGLGTLAGFVGGDVAGYGLLSHAVDRALEEPPLLRALPYLAGATTLFATLGGPVGWGLAAIGWVATWFGNRIWGSRWKGQVMEQVDRHIIEHVVPHLQAWLKNNIESARAGLKRGGEQQLRAVASRLHSLVEGLEQQAHSETDQRNRELAAMRSRASRLEEVKGKLEKLEAEVRPEVRAVEEEGRGGPVPNDDADELGDGDANGACDEGGGSHGGTGG